MEPASKVRVGATRRHMRRQPATWTVSHQKKFGTSFIGPLAVGTPRLTHTWRLRKRICGMPSMKWAHVSELCGLQAVSKRFHQVASTVQNLQCRISPFTFKSDLSGLAGFLGQARYLKGLRIVIKAHQTPTPGLSHWRRIVEFQLGPRFAAAFGPL